MPFVNLVDSKGKTYGKEFISDGAGAPRFLKRLSQGEFRKSFTRQQYRQIEAKTKTDDDIFTLWDIAHSTVGVDLEDADVIAGMAALVPSVIKQADHDKIMLGIPL